VAVAVAVAMAEAMEAEAVVTAGEMAVAASRISELYNVRHNNKEA